MTNWKHCSKTGSAEPPDQLRAQCSLHFLEERGARVGNTTTTQCHIKGGGSGIGGGPREDDPNGRPMLGDVERR